MSESEKQLAEFIDGYGCEIRLTSEKVYAKSIGIEETYALRSIDGVGVYDDINQYAEDKIKINKQADKWRTWGVILSVIGGFMLLGFLVNIKEYEMLIPNLLVGGIFGFFGYRLIRNSILLRKTVKLNSYIKLIISGNNKLFKFNKKDSESDKVADFLNKIEDTLTKYN